VESLPGYAPELNPVEALWSSLKGAELANLAGDTLNDVITAAERGIQRIRDTPPPGLLVPRSLRPGPVVSMSPEEAKLLKVQADMAGPEGLGSILGQQPITIATNSPALTGHHKTEVLAVLEDGSSGRADPPRARR